MNVPSLNLQTRSPVWHLIDFSLINKLFIPLCYTIFSIILLIYPKLIHCPIAILIYQSPYTPHYSILSPFKHTSHLEWNQHDKRKKSITQITPPPEIPRVFTKDLPASQTGKKRMEIAWEKE
ncbi:hypothetical protein EYC80_003914 [Monilinia laxa]|uniref:Uncharacterized protein n=1 Tax=Monilinia laxa TaxID=61186 RepID=A0A5N6KLG4_MONLA|nr:hypothetical protein EYC80_003914 [Monilinia laxa]